MANAARDGYAEAPVKDQKNIDAWAAEFASIKQAAEYFGRRPVRYTVVPDDGQPLPAGAKRLHFVRHGEGYHNVYRAKEFAAGRTPHAKRGNLHEVPAELHDPRLTEKGRAEAALAAASLRGRRPAPRPELLVTSPLRRAVQTLLLVFEDAVAAGAPALAHELCREAFRGPDPSLYDSRLSRGALAAEFPGVDFASYVLAPERAPGGEAEEAAAVGDPLWWRCGSAFGGCEGGPHSAAIAEHAWGFLNWLVAVRPEREIAVATHSLFLLALFHGALEPPGGGRWPSPQVFHTGEVRSLVVAGAPPPPAMGGELARWGPALVGPGLGAEEEEAEAEADGAAPPAKRARSG